MSDENCLSTKRSWFMWFVASLFYMYAVILRVSPSVMTDDLMEYFSVSSFELGFLSSCFYYAYVFLQVPCGIFLDKLGVRKMVTISALVASLGSFLFGTAKVIFAAEIGRFLIGCGAACGFISCLKVGMEWFTPKQFALIPGISTMMGTLGGTFAGRPLAHVVTKFGWQNTMLSLTVFGVFLAIFSYTFLRDSKTFNKEEYPPLKKTLKLFFNSPKLLLIGIVGGFMYLPVSVFAELWGIPFLSNTYQITKEYASIITTMVFLGVAIGGPIFALFRKNLNYGYNSILQFASAVSAVLFFLIAQNFPIWSAFIFLFSIGLCIGAESLCFAWAKDIMPTSVGGTAVAFTNALVMFVGGILQPIIGGVLDMFWDGKLSNGGVPIYSNIAYQKAIMTIPICLLASCVILFIMKRLERTNSY